MAQPPLSRDSRTSLAIGAAVVPPTPVWFCSTTATAYLGWLAGAKQMNQAVLIPLLPVSAVPVLPATGTPGICAAVPVPPVTTASIMDVSSAAVLGFIATLSFEGDVFVTSEPLGETTLFTTYGLITTPWLATPAATIAIC